MPSDYLRRLRQKYPQYADIPDQQLAQLILKKYPQYQDVLGDVAAGPRLPTQVSRPTFGERAEAVAGKITGALVAPQQFIERTALRGGTIEQGLRSLGIPEPWASHPLSPLVLAGRMGSDPLAFIAMVPGAIRQGLARPAVQVAVRAGRAVPAVEMAPPRFRVLAPEAPPVVQRPMTASRAVTPSPIEAPPARIPAPPGVPTPVSTPQTIPAHVVRFSEKGTPAATIADVSKPHGLYTSPSGVVSPHADLGGPRVEFRVNPGARVLTVDATEFVGTNRGTTVGQSAGLAVVRKFRGDQEFQRLVRLPRKELTGYLQGLYPKIQWLRYFDQHEMLEAYGAQLARKNGYDAIWAVDRKAPEFSEFVGLNRKAFAPQPPAQAPLIETKPIAPVLGLVGQEAKAPPTVSAVQELLVAPPLGAGKMQPVSVLGRVPVGGSTILGHVADAGPLKPAYDVVVRRNSRSSWGLSAQSARENQRLGNFTSLKALTQRVDKVLAESTPLPQLKVKVAQRSVAARGGQWKRKDREFVEGYEAYLQATEQNLAEVAPAIAERAQRGAVTLPGRAAAAPLSPEVETIFRLGDPGLRPRIQQAVQRTTERTRIFFAAPGAELQGSKTPTSTWQEVRNDFRLFKDVPRVDVPKRVGRDVIGVVAPLDHQEYQAFNRYVVLRDLNEEAQIAATQGRRPSIPTGASPAQITQDLQGLEAQLSPKIHAAVARHDRLEKAITDDLIARARLSPDDARQFHFRHYVLDYDELRGTVPAQPIGLGGPGLKQQQPRGLRARTGSQRAIQTDYIDVQQRKLTRYYLDNGAEDFTASLQPKVDYLATLTKDQRQALFGPSGRPSRAGQIVDVPGVGRLVTWQPEPGNNLFPGYTVANKIINDATVRTLTAEELAQAAQSVAPSLVGARQALVLGGTKPVWLVDPKVAHYLDTYALGQKNGDLLRQANAFMGIWKRGIVDFLGLPFQFRNAVGDLENGFLIGNLPARTPLGRAAGILVKDAYGGALSADEKVLLDLARQQRVVGSGFVGTVRTPLRAQPEIAHLEEPLVAAARFPGRVLGVYERAFRVREDIARLASFMDNVERIQRGEMIRVSKAIDIRGLQPIAAAGKVAREAFVDYGNRSMAEDTFRQTIAPFVTWFYQNARNWANLAARDPKQIAVKSLPVYAALFTWNNTGDRARIETALPKWQRMMPHLITGWELPDGRPLVISLGSTAATGAAQMVGLTKAFDLSGQVARGELTVEDALRKLPGGMLTEAARTLAFTATGPLVTTPAEVALAVTSGGRQLVDIRRGVSRVPERLAGTAAGIRQFAGREARALVPPADILLRQFEAPKTLPPGVPLATRAAMAIGAVRPVDLEAEARRRQVEASQRAEAGLEDRLYRVERIFTRTGDVGIAMREATRLKVPADTVIRRLTSTRVQIDRVREQLRRERDREKYAALRRRLELLYTQAAQERLKQTPRSVRGEAQPQP